MSFNVCFDSHHLSFLKQIINYEMFIQLRRYCIKLNELVLSVDERQSLIYDKCEKLCG